MIDFNRLKASFQELVSTPQGAAIVAALVLSAIVIGLFVNWVLAIVVLALDALALYFVAQRAPGAIFGSARPRSMALGIRWPDPGRLQGTYRESMERALNTGRRIERAIEETGDPSLRKALLDATRDLEELVQTIYTLAMKAHSVQTGLQSSNDMARLSAEIEHLNNQIKSTNDEFQKSQYHAALDGKLQQMQNYTDITVALKRWESQLDNALSTLDTILSQVLRIRSSEVLHRSVDTDEVSRSLREQVESLKAASDAFDSVYGGIGGPGSR